MTNMTNMTSNRIKKLAVGTAITFMLGGGATALLVPTLASATVTSARVASGGADDPAGHLRRGADDIVGHAKNVADDPASHLRHGTDDVVGHATKNGTDDVVGHAKHGVDDMVGNAKHGAEDVVGHG